MLTNNINTHGAAYGRALQQLMTGVYISEVCLIGLFAINTAPGPIVLMVVFLVFTALYHAMMRNALRPLVKYLPDSIEGDAEAPFERSDIGDYDASQTRLVPSEAPLPPLTTLSSRKAALYTRLFNPRTAQSYAKVRALIPSYSPPRYVEREEEFAYYNPAITSLKPRLWIVRDEMGISQKEVRESTQVVDISDDFARFDEKGKIAWDSDRLQSVPIWEKRIDY